MGAFPRLLLSVALWVFPSSSGCPNRRPFVLPVVAISGTDVQFRPPPRSMLPWFEDERTLGPERKSPQICASACSSSATQLNDGQVLTPLQVAHHKSEPGPASSLDLGLRRRA